MDLRCASRTTSASEAKPDLTRGRNGYLTNTVCPKTQIRGSGLAGQLAIERYARW